MIDWDISSISSLTAHEFVETQKMSDSSDDGSGVPTTTTNPAQDVVVTALEENKRTRNSDSSSDESQLAPNSKPAKGSEGEWELA